MDNLDQVKGKKVASFPEAELFEGFPYFFYEVITPLLTNEEISLSENLTAFINRKISFSELEEKLGKISPEFYDLFREKIITVVESEDLLTKLPDSDTFHALKIDLVAFIKQHMPKVKNISTVVNNILDNSIGFGQISAMMRDPNLEEIMVNGFDKFVFVLHKEYGMCKTNMYISHKEQQIQELVSRIAKFSGRKFSDEHPLIDSRLPDGSRANATFSTVTPFGPTLTIRKFNYVPISIIDMIEKGTMNAEIAAFLWMMIEGMDIEPMNCIITGGTSSGKTTTLNALTTFINHRDRIVTIEDTIELNLGGRENWIQMEAKPKIKEQPEITMDDLLKNSLRMRPDRIIVGEVRGEEAQTLFVAMDTGHKGILGTLHSNTAREMMIRLKNAPMNVPEQMLPLLDIVVVHYRMYDREKGLIRRIAQVAEISRMDEKVLLSNIFEWNPKKDETVRTDIPSHTLQTLADKTGLSKTALKNEMLVRQRILEWMLENNIRSAPNVEKIIQQYYHDPNSILEKIS
ncbi:MAG: ATPase, T2SS/T4P/T4SS family [Candidatus Diapherotrites archaeon]|nr:ATPase, T2SS/T4P/T4SS family [Candidatus Diapherotrites archaeon]